MALNTFKCYLCNYTLRVKKLRLKQYQYTVSVPLRKQLDPCHGAYVYPSTAASRHCRMTQCHTALRPQQGQPKPTPWLYALSAAHQPGLPNTHTHTHILLITHANNNHCQFPMYGGVTTTTVLGTKFTQLLMTIALWPSFTVIISGHVTALCYSMITTVIVAVCYCYYYYYCYYYCWCSYYYYYCYFSKLPIALKFEKMQPLLLLPSSFYQLIQLSLQCENGLLQVILQYRSSQPSLALKNNTKTYFLYIYTKHKTNSTVPYRVQ